MTDSGITSFGAYIPRLRIERRTIAAAHGWMAPSLAGMRGSRAFCSWDEDAITMAVEAARRCIATGTRGRIRSLGLVSTTFPYADLQNSAIVAGALALPKSVRTADIGGSQRAGISALTDALRVGDDQLVIASDRPRAKPASVQEMAFGAGAAAFRVGCDRPIAVLLGAGTVLAPFVDHFRAAGVPHDYAWEERWVRDEGHAKLIPAAVAAALADANIAIGEVASFILASPLRGAAVAMAKRLGFAGTVAEAFDDGCGYAGAAHALLMLAGVLETALPGQNILLAGFGQGAEALVLRTTEAIAGNGFHGPQRALREALPTTHYLRMLSYYGEIDLDWGMRGEKTGKAALTTQFREAGQIDAFVAGKCAACGTVQFPRLAYCVNPACTAPASQFTDFPLTEQPARVMTFTADWLSYHPAPPLIVGFVQFNAGARLLMEIVDADEKTLEIGSRLAIVFRIKEPDKIRGYNRYFWKATPVMEAV